MPLRVLPDQAGGFLRAHVEALSQDFEREPRGISVVLAELPQHVQRVGRGHARAPDHADALEPPDPEQFRCQAAAGAAERQPRMRGLGQQLDYALFMRIEGHGARHGQQHEEVQDILGGLAGAFVAEAFEFLARTGPAVGQETERNDPVRANLHGAPRAGAHCAVPAEAGRLDVRGGHARAPMADLRALRAEGQLRVAQRGDVRRSAAHVHHEGVRATRQEPPTHGARGRSAQDALDRAGAGGVRAHDGAVAPDDKQRRVDTHVPEHLLDRAEQALDERQQACVQDGRVRPVHEVEPPGQLVPAHDGQVVTLLEQALYFDLMGRVAHRTVAAHGERSGALAHHLLGGSQNLVRVHGALRQALNGHPRPDAAEQRRLDAPGDLLVIRHHYQAHGPAPPLYDGVRGQRGRQAGVADALEQRRIEP